MRPFVFLFLLGCIIPVFNISGQDQTKIDSLYRLLRKEKSDTGQVTLNYRLSYELQVSDPAKAREHAEAALELADKSGFSKGKGNTLIQFGNLALSEGDYETAIKYYNNALEILREVDDNRGEAICLNNLGIISHNKGQYRDALAYYRQSLEISRKQNRKQNITTSLLCMGAVYENISKLDSALVYYIEARKISGEISDSKLVAVSSNSLASIYFLMGNYSKAEEHYSEAIRLFEKTGNILGILKTSFSLGQTKELLGDYAGALSHYSLALDMAFRTGSSSDLSNIYYAVGRLYEYSGSADSAFTYYSKSLSHANQSDNTENAVNLLVSMARIENSRNNFNSALNLLTKSLSLASDINNQSLDSRVYEELARTLDGLGRYNEAYQYLKRYSEIKDSLMTAEKQEQILELQTKYETEKKEQQNLMLLKDRKILTTTRNSLIGGAVLLLIILMVIFRSLIIKKRDNRILKEQKEEIAKQKEIVEIQKTSITDSIRYAKRIQSAMLPPDDLLNTEMPDSFILYLPRDIVSGDFYWIKEIDNDRLLACAADCTGHGVPGAFMSMLGMSVLSNIISEYADSISDGSCRTGDILGLMRTRIKVSLRQTGKEGEARDGMDMSICIIDRTRRSLVYSGANNSLYYVSDGVLNEIKATRNPVGVYINETDFESHEIAIEKNSVIYLFSDGYSDQIGPDGRKFLSKNFKSLLASISHLPMEKIKEEVYNRHIDWRKGEEQVDDILVMGIRI